jgi:hypothetical protein
LVLFKKYSPDEYPSYDNFDGIEIGRTVNIPDDYMGVMGVPITFLDKHNPDQFDIVGITKAWSGNAIKTYPLQTQISANGKRSKVRKLNDGVAMKVSTPPAGKTYYEVGGDYYVQLYPRVLIKRKETRDED